MALLTWGSNRRTRSAPGDQINGFQPEEHKTILSAAELEWMMERIAPFGLSSAAAKPLVRTITR